MHEAKNQGFTWRLRRHLDGMVEKSPPQTDSLLGLQSLSQDGINRPWMVMGWDGNFCVW